MTKTQEARYDAYTHLDEAIAVMANRVDEYIDRRTYCLLRTREWMHQRIVRLLDWDIEPVHLKMMEKQLGTWRVDEMLLNMAQAYHEEIAAIEEEVRPALEAALERQDREWAAQAAYELRCAYEAV